jgi:hypothetical protein
LSLLPKLTVSFQYLKVRLFPTLGVYSREGYMVQPDLSRFSSSILNLTVNATNIGIVSNKGITFNWMTRMLVVCGGQQVDLFLLKKE